MKVISTEELYLVWCALLLADQSWALGEGGEHDHADAGLLWDKSACHLGQVIPAVDMCFLICKLKGVHWVTLKDTSVLPLNWVSPKRKAHCSEEWHETVGLGPCRCHPFTVGSWRFVSLAKLMWYCVNVSQRKLRNFLLGKRRWELRQGIILFGTPYCLD